MQPFRYGILGSGFMGRTHAEALRHIEGAQLTALALGSRAAVPLAQATAAAAPVLSASSASSSSISGPAM